MALSLPWAGLRVTRSYGRHACSRTATRSREQHTQLFFRNPYTQHTSRCVFEQGAGSSKRLPHIHVVSTGRRGTPRRRWSTSARPQRRFRQTRNLAHLTGVEESSTFLPDPAYLQDHDQQQQQQQQQPTPHDVQLPIKPVLAEPRSHDRDRFDFNDSDPPLTTDEERLRMRI